jgi:alkylation response protein AidB-like acyl-CoA dehydrogenase
MRATCSHDVLFDNVLVPLDHAVSVSPWSTPQPELDGEGLLWMSVLLSSVYDAVAQAARDWLVNWLEERQPSNLGAALSTLPRFRKPSDTSTPYCSPTAACSTPPPKATPRRPMRRS